ncbi:MAG: sensor histidine kinase, partial [Jannaschia helgolandensis]
MRSHSLRSRLILIILAPLLVISLVAGAWQFRTTTLRAESIFDRGLLSAALAISRDIAVSDGDALSPATRRLINDTSGGELFYHVFAPDGVFVTGYSTPPILPKAAPLRQTEPYYFNARYQGQDVRVLRFQDGTTVSGIAGIFNITVWQNADVRSSFVREVVSRSFAVIALLILSVALVVWFGVGLGLRPLLDLEKAIAKRSPTELEPIRRAVPIEARGLVDTLNRLLDRISRRISSKDEFISNAAHQLRNPVAGVLALAEAVHNAPNVQAAKQRSAELVQAARETSILTNQLLSFERAGGKELDQSGEPLDLKALVEQVVDSFRQQNADTKIEISLGLPEADVRIQGDAV